MANYTCATTPASPPSIAALALDLYSAAVSVNTISHQMESGQWEALRLTALPAQDVIAAKHAVAQVRAWRVVALEVAVRMLGLVVLIASTTFVDTCAVFFGPFNSRCYVGVWSLSGDIASFQHEFLMNLSGIIVALLLVMAYLSEPLWRMRTITALGLAISSRIHSLTVASLAAFGAIVTLHVAQAALVIGTLKLSDILWNLARSYPVSLPFNIAVVLGNLIISLALVILVVGYRTLYSAALNCARQRAFRAD